VLKYFERMGKPGGFPCPSLMLLDLNLPAIDGTQILNEFRTYQDCDEVPVIVMTSSDSPRDVARAEQMGVSHYFRKPSDLVDFVELGAVVKALAEQARQQSIS
jgi:DNA-binding response OmpR family regulator